MIQPDEEVIRGFAHVAQNVPVVTKFMADWLKRELARLPQTTNGLGVAQGRCQVLGELDKLLTDAPGHAAESRKG